MSGCKGALKANATKRANEVLGREQATAKRLHSRAQGKLSGEAAKRHPGYTGRVCRLKPPRGFTSDNRTRATLVQPLRGNLTNYRCFPGCAARPWASEC